MRRVRKAAIAVSTVVAAGTLASAASAANCPDAPIRPTTAGDRPAGCFVYEKISPEYKGNGEVAGGAALIPGFRASLSGDHVIYGADSVFLGAPTFPQVNAFYAHRESGAWDSASVGAMLPSQMPLNITNPAPEDLVDAFAPFTMSEDGRWTYLGSNLLPGTTTKVPVRGYVLDLRSGQATRFTPMPASGSPVVSLDPTYGLSPGVVVGDGERVVYPSPSRLTADSVGLPDDNALRLYSTENGQTTLISRRPDGAPSNGRLAEGMGPRGMWRWSVSADGRTAWWASQLGSEAPLYRSAVDGSPSVFVNASENTAATVAPGNATAIGASTDGTRMLFTTFDALVTGTETSYGRRLYLYEHSANPATDRNLTLVSTAGEPADTSSIEVLPNVSRTSEDGRTVYFWTSRKQLVAGGPVGPGAKLYRWHDGQLEYLATANPDALALASNDGRYYVFDSDTSGLTSKPSGGQLQRYRYDAQTGTIDCVSCSSTGTPAAVVPPPFLNFMQMGETERRYLSSDGQVIFETSTRLVNEDTNGLVDVYAWKDGRATLISSGRATSDVRFADANADGSSVFFVTRDRLSAWDTDTRADLYVARRDGGQPEPNERPVSTCRGDDCQGTPGGPVALPTLGTVGFVGTGNRPEVTDASTPAKASVVKPKTVRGTAATLRVRVPAKGAVRVSGNGLRQASRSAAKAQTVKIPVRLSTLAKRRVAKAGKATVRVTVRYVPSSGRAQTMRVKVTFKRATAAKSRASHGAVAKGGR